MKGGGGCTAFCTALILFIVPGGLQQFQMESCKPIKRLKDKEEEKKKNKKNKKTWCIGDHLILLFIFNSRY
jgi:hypothetical protein